MDLRKKWKIHECNSEVPGPTIKEKVIYMDIRVLVWLWYFQPVERRIWQMVIEVIEHAILLKAGFWLP